MLGSHRALRVWVYMSPCDMRKSFHTLGKLVAQEMGKEVYAADLFLFISRDCKKAKVLYFDGTGMVIWNKRMEKGKLRPLYRKRHKKEVLELTVVELELFLEGSESVGRQKLSPPLLSREEMQSKVGV